MKRLLREFNPFQRKPLTPPLQPKLSKPSCTQPCFRVVTPTRYAFSPFHPVSASYTPNVPYLLQHKRIVYSRIRGRIMCILQKRKTRDRCRKKSVSFKSPFTTGAATPTRTSDPQNINLLHPPPPASTISISNYPTHSGTFEQEEEKSYGMEVKLRPKINLFNY